MNSKCMRKKGYTFNNQIVTDGVSASILFLRNDRYKKHASNRCSGKVLKKPKNYKRDQYVDSLPDPSKFKNYKIVGGDDAGKCDRYIR